MPSPLQVSVIDDKLREKFVTEFQHMRNHSTGALATFLDFITYRCKAGSGNADSAWADDNCVTVSAYACLCLQQGKWLDVLPYAHKFKWLD